MPEFAHSFEEGNAAGLIWEQVGAIDDLVHLPDPDANRPGSLHDTREKVCVTDVLAGSAIQYYMQWLRQLEKNKEISYIPVAGILMPNGAQDEYFMMSDGRVFATAKSQAMPIEMYTYLERMYSAMKSGRPEVTIGIDYI